MERLLEFSLTTSSVVFILKAFVFATGQDDSTCQNLDLTASEGTITSPNYPSYYPSNISCTWSVNVGVNYCSSIELHIADFDLQDRNHSGECHYNFQIYDTIGKKQLTQLECGQEPEENPLRTAASTSHSVDITITSGDTIEGRGFNITYKTDPQEEYVIFVDARGTIVVEDQLCYTRWTLYNNTDRQLAAVQFDTSKRIFYISDTREKVISRYELIGWREELRFKDHIVTDDIENVTSIVVDSVNERLYWSDASLHTISTSRLDGSQRRDLFTSDLVAPSNLLLGPECRYIYWTSTRAGSSTIERAFVNGTSREKAEYESGNGSFVLAIAGQTLYRISTRTGFLRLYNLRPSPRFLKREKNRDLYYKSLQSATSAIKIDSFLCWSAYSGTDCAALNEDPVFIATLPDAPPSSQLLYHTTKTEQSVYSCAPFNEPPLEASTADSHTKASSSTENSDKLRTSLSTYITNPPKSTVPTASLPRAETSEKSEQIKTSLSTNITMYPKSTVVTTDHSTKASSSTENSVGLQTSLSTYVTNSPTSTVLTALLPRAETSENSEQIKTSLSTNITKYPKSTVVTTILTLKGPNSVSSNQRPHRAYMKFWHILLVLVLAMIICLGLLFASIKYKRSMSRSLHLPYPDKITFKLLEKQQQSFSTSV